MSKIIPFPGVRRPVFSCVDGASDGLFVLHTDECGHKETFGPFPDPSEAREFAANISAQANIPVDWETFPQPYVPDPRSTLPTTPTWLELWRLEILVCVVPTLAGSRLWW